MPFLDLHLIICSLLPETYNSMILKHALHMKSINIDIHSIIDQRRR